MRLLKGFVKCFSSYDPSWSQPLELMSSGLKIQLTMLAPTIAIILLGSIMPSSTTPASMNYDGLLSPSLVDSFSPYASHAAHLSLPPASVSNVDMSYIFRLCTLSVLSPVTFDILFRHFLSITRMTLSRLVVVLMSRKRADDSAKAILTQRVRSGRAMRRRGYDMYFPPKKVDKQRIKQRGKTLIPSLFFFPGFGIDHAAYSDVASKLSDQGIAVAVISLEPLRLAHKALGGGIDDIYRLLRVAGKDISRYYKHESASPLIIEWNLGGHSMGGYFSLQLAEDIINQSQFPSVIILKRKTKSVSRVGSDIVVWAAGNLVDSVPNLRINIRPPLRVLVLNGSTDGIVKMSPQQKRKLLSKLPKSTTELRTIKGANHSGFASYDTASKNSSTFAMNGPRTITLEAQHDEACSQTIRFLLDRYR
jgi:hypothetical protein